MNTKPKLAAKPKVVWIDNNPTSQRVAHRALGADFDVKTALSELESLEIVQSFTPDAIVLDVDFPNIQSLDLCTTLRAKPEFSAIPVVFLSQVETTEERFKAFQAGGDEYIQKPIDESLLKTKLNRTIKRARQQAALAKTSTKAHPALEENIQTLHEYLLGLIEMENDKFIGELTLNTLDKLGLKGALRWHFNGDIHTSVGPLSDLEKALLQQAKQTLPRGYSARDLWGSEFVGIIIHNMPSQKSRQYQTMYQLLNTLFKAVNSTVKKLLNQPNSGDGKVAPSREALTAAFGTDTARQAENAVCAQFSELEAAIESLENDSEKYLGELSSTLQSQSAGEANEHDKQLFHKLLNQSIQARITLYDRCLDAQAKLRVLKSEVIETAKNDQTPA